MASRARILAVAALLLPTIPAGAYHFPEYLFETTLGNRGLASVDGDGFLVGGSTTAGNRVTKYDPATGAESDFATLPNAVASPAVVVAHDPPILHVFGGSYVQGVNPATAATFVIGTLPSALTGRVSVVAVDPAATPTTRFLMVGAGTADGNGGQQVRLLDEADLSASPVILGTVPATEPQPPLLATGDGFFLFVRGKVYEIRPDGPEPKVALLTDPDVPTTSVASGDAVWRGDHAVIFDAQGKIHVWRPPSEAWPATRGVVHLDDSYIASPPRAAVIGEHVHFLEPGSPDAVYRWDLPEIEPSFASECQGTLDCVLDAKTASYPRSLKFEWTVDGLARPAGDTLALTLGSVDDRPHVRLRAIDALGRSAVVEEEFYPPLGPPDVVVRFRCFETNTTCHLDARATTDPDGGTIQGMNVLAPTAEGCIAGSEPKVFDCDFASAGPHPVRVLARDNLGLVGYWNATLDARGWPAIVLEPADCTGLRCFISAKIWDDEDGLASIDAGLGGSSPCPYFPDFSPGDGWPCFLFATFPANGTYPVTATAVGADDKLAIETYQVRAENLAPALNPIVHCPEGTVRCWAAAYAYDLDTSDFTLPVRWEVAPGTFVDGREIVHSFGPGIHRVRASAVDAHGWRVVEERVVAPRPYEWRNLPPLPASTAPPLVAGMFDRAVTLEASGGAFDRLRFLPEGGSWSAPASLPQGVRSPALAASSRVFVLGGANDAGDPLSLVQVYAPETQTWTTGQELPTPVSGAAAVASYEGVWMLGGFDAAGATNVVRRLEGDTWQRLADLPWSGATRAAEGYGTVFAAGEVGGVWKLARYERGGTRANDRWVVLDAPDGGLAPIVALGSQGGRLWVLEDGPTQALRAWDPFAPFAAARWDLPAAPPENFVALASTGNGLVGFSATLAGDDRNVFAQRLPATALDRLSVALRPVVTQGFPASLTITANAATPGAFQEVVFVAVWPARPDATDPLWESEVPLTNLSPIGRVALPKLPPGMYRVDVKAVATRHESTSPLAVTSVWS